MNWLLGITVVTLFCGVYSQCPTQDNEVNTKVKDNTRETLYNGQQNFTLRLFESINKVKGKDNVFFSPYSVYHTLLLAYFTSGGKTEQELKKALFLGDESKLDLMRAYKLDQYSREVQPSESYIFDSVNRVYVDSNLPVKQCLIDFFQKEMEALDFNKKPDEARIQINNLVSNITKGNILDLLPKDAVDTETKLVLVNAAHFKGLWTSKFQADSTRKEVFYITPERQTFVNMMKQKGKFNHGVSEELGASILEMPYKGDDVSMFVLLPPFANQNGVDEILEKFSPDLLTQVVDGHFLMPKQVEVQFPKYTMEKSLELRSVLEHMGVGDLFEASSDFSSLTGVVGPHFNDAIHKAKIAVDEDGTVASAATAIFSFRSSRPSEPSRFICNHPFVYLIYDKPTRAVTFMGVFREPKMLS